MAEGGVQHDRTGFMKAGGLDIAFQRWTPAGVAPEAVPAERRVLAYPGWLDNSGTWEPLAPLLARAGYLVVALDPPGCGLSEHHSRAAWYHDFEECVLLGEAADELGWVEPFIVLAHSRGSNITATASGALVERIRAIVLVESVLGMAGTYASNYPEMGRNRFGTLQQAMGTRARNLVRKPKLFASEDEAVTFNEKNEVFTKARHLAAAIVRRHIFQRPDGQWGFTHDIRTYGQVQSRYISPGMSAEFAAQVKCPVLIITASDTWALAMVPEATEEDAADAASIRGFEIPRAARIHNFRDIRDRLSRVKNLDNVMVEGKHHLHGDDPQRTADAVLPWLEAAIQRAVVPHEPLPDLRAEHDDLFEQESVRHLLEAARTRVPHVATVAAAPVAAKACSTAMAPHEILIETEGLVLAAKRWGRVDAARKVIAWCDARDNAGSFDRLAALTITAHPELCVIAVDPPGLGKSSRNVPADYTFGVTEEAALMVYAADQLGFETFAAWGHGRGATVALIAAGSFPKRVASVACFDPRTGSVPDAWGPSEMSQCLLERQQPLPALPTFGSTEALAERLMSDPVFPKSRETALALAARRTRAAVRSGGVQLSDDPRVFRARPFALGMTESSMHLVLDTVACPVVVFSPRASSRRTRSPTQARRLEEELGALDSALLRRVEVAGASHAHSCHAEAVLPPLLATTFSRL